MTADLIEYSLSTASASTSMTKLVAEMVAALEGAPTWSSTDMLRFEAIVNCSWRVQGSLLALVRLSMCRLSLTCTAALATFVSTTIESSVADASTLWRLVEALVANGRRPGTPASARNLDFLQAGHAFADMTLLLTFMTTWKCLQADL